MEVEIKLEAVALLLRLPLPGPSADPHHTGRMVAHRAVLCRLTGASSPDVNLGLDPIKAGAQIVFGAAALHNPSKPNVFIGRNGTLGTQPSNEVSGVQQFVSEVSAFLR
jgi:hypothetical protein